jgi:DNA-binding GntR family transcriptional regulator
VFDTSRTPVRTALGELLEQGRIQRFEGRGFIVSGSRDTPPQRVKLTSEMFGLEQNGMPEPPPVAAQRIARGFEDSLANALPFGLFRVNEQAAADHFEVSRTTIRELLSRFQDRGLISKDRRSHWVVGPLTARDVAHFFSIRGKLEPLALLDSAPRLPPSEIERMWHGANDAITGRTRLDVDTKEELEADIHIRLLSKSPNSFLLGMIHQTQIALVVNRVFASFVGPQPFEGALREHLIILEFLRRGAYEAAAQALEEHMRLSATRTRNRLMAISVFPEPELPKYLQRQVP